MKPCIRLCLLLVFPLALAACGEPEDTHPGTPVAHRRAAFLAMLKSFEPMRERLHDGQYNAQEFAAMAAKFNQLKDVPWQYFTPGSVYPPSHASDLVWSDATEFAADRKALYDATSNFVAVAGSGDVGKVTAAYERVYAACEDCHKVFRKR